LNHQSDCAGEDVLVDTTTGALFPAAPTGSLLLSSVPLGWRGIIVEWHGLPPRELSQHYVTGHGISVNTGAHPIPFGWNGRKEWRDSVINPGESHFLTQGELNTPRRLRTFDEISIVLSVSARERRTMDLQALSDRAEINEAWEICRFQNAGSDHEEETNSDYRSWFGLW
jgi:hypothetical protein